MNNHERLIKENDTYRRGMRREAVVLDTLAGMGWEVWESSREDNVRNDIDGWRSVSMPDGRHACLPLSVKSMTARTFAQSGSLLFELYVLDRHSMNWFPSWFHTGKAAAYVVDIEGDGLYYVSKAKLQAYVSENGFDRTVQNTPEVVTSQYVSRHSHLDSQSGIIQLAKLLRHGVARLIVKYDKPAPAAPVRRSR